ncbi:hypothetical protein HY486_00540 [Candidatus Woesearchaeota archaeon]|nr:hypothetical protein [Candidatus Woesearchaeota archaeon]
MPAKPPTIIKTGFITYDTEKGEDAYLLYSKGTEICSLGIQRDGIGSPWTWDIYTHNKRVTNPEAQRRGTYLIDDNSVLIEAKSILKAWLKEKGVPDKELEKEVAIPLREFLSKRVMPSGIGAEYEAWLSELWNTPNYQDLFGGTYPKMQILGMQGCGNLTMNSWFVAYVDSKYSEKPQFIYRRDEQVEKREYTCFVKRKKPKENDRPVTKYSIEKLRFNVQSNEVIDSNGVNIIKDIEFAVFGQQLVENGELIGLDDIIEQFEDIRHVFRLPNINPKDSLAAYGAIEQAEYPRTLFGETRRDDVWFGEREMTRENKRNILRQALTQPIILDRQFDFMGASLSLIKAALKAPTGGGYTEITDLKQAIVQRGQWRVVRDNDNLIQIFLQRNVYPYTMLGLNSTGQIIAAAAGGKAGRVGQTLEAMAQNMIGEGAVSVLLIDEGLDVHQRFFDGKTLGYIVPPGRGRLRSEIIFAVPTEPSSSG